MAKSKKAKIEQVHQEEAAKLKALFKERTDLTQQEFGERYEIGSQGMVWQYLNARSPLNIDAAVKFAAGLSCCLADFSPRLEEDRQKLSNLSALPGANQAPVDANCKSFQLQAGFPSGVASSPNKGNIHDLRLFTFGDIMEGKHSPEAPVSPEQPTFASHERFGPRAFAVRIEDDTMAGGPKPLTAGMVAFVDPDTEPGHNKLVLVHEPNTRPVIRQLVQDGPLFYVKAMAPGMAVRQIKLEHVVGVLRRAVAVTDLDE